MNKMVNGEKHSCPLVKVVLTKEMVCETHKHYDDYGIEMYVLVYGVPIINNVGDVLYMIEAAVDVTATVQLENQLAETLIVTQRANDAVTNFLTNLDHEFHTPLNELIYLIDQLLTDDSSSIHKGLLLKARRKVFETVNVQQNISDMAALAASRLEFSYKPFCLQDVLAEVIKELNPIAEEKGLLIDVVHTGNYTSGIIGDSQRWCHIIKHIVGNALKFTEKGHVRVVLESNLGSDDEVLVNLSVNDTGIGIAESDFVRIFKPFVQVDGSLTCQFEGNGLGLSLAALLAEKMGGVIDVKSTVGVGSEFALKVTVKKSLEILAPANIVDNADPLLVWQGKRVLVVDDNKTNSMILERLLTINGASVICAADGFIAVEMYKEEGPFDILLMDIQMPVMDGYQATEAIRKSEIKDKSGKHIPIIAVTAHTSKDHKGRGYSIGIDDYHSKPIDFATLSLTACKYLLITQQKDLVPDFSVSRVEVMNLELVAVVNALGLEEADVKEILDIFVCDTRELVNELGGYVKECNIEGIREICHTLKGSSLPFDDFIAAAKQVHYFAYLYNARNLLHKGGKSNIESARKIIAEADKIKFIPGLIDILPKIKKKDTLKPALEESYDNLKTVFEMVVCWIESLS